MTPIERYEQQIEEAVRSGDKAMINLIAQCLEQASQAKHVLRTHGYGWTGLDLLETAKLVPDNEE